MAVKKNPIEVDPIRSELDAALSDIATHNIKACNAPGFKLPALLTALTNAVFALAALAGHHTNEDSTPSS